VILLFYSTTLAKTPALTLRDGHASATIAIGPTYLSETAPLCDNCSVSLCFLYLSVFDYFDLFAVMSAY